MTKKPPDDPNTPTREVGPKMRYLRTRNSLREKAGGGTPGQPDKIPDELLHLASAEPAKMAEQYPDFLTDSVAALYAAHGKAAASIEGRHVHFAELNVLAHEMKGQGGTSGYPLITMFGGLLSDFTSAGATRTDYDIEIVKAIISLAKNLNLEVIAEGIETEEQLEQLQLLGCKLGQGYLFAEPMSYEDATHRITAGPQPPGKPDEIP